MEKFEETVNDYGIGLDKDGKSIAAILDNYGSEQLTQEAVDSLVNLANEVPDYAKLPTKPGKYLSASSGSEWTLREDGVWVDCRGDYRPKGWNFILVLTGLGIDLTPVED